VARKRMIDPQFWCDEKMMTLSHSARLLFIGLWNFCDDSGIHKDSDLKLKAEIFPADDITKDDVKKLKEELIQIGLIIAIKEDEFGDDILMVKNWNKYQKINRPIPSKYNISEDSLNAHGVIIPNRIEYNRIEYNKTKQVVGLKDKIKKEKLINATN
tara:strand:- start:2572 stop:3042 length:471 start_codon:yes stop_codon:yes gene_type:complete